VTADISHVAGRSMLKYSERRRGREARNRIKVEEERKGNWHTVSKNSPSNPT
jgi:hypothetical protein